MKSNRSLILKVPHIGSTSIKNLIKEYLQPISKPILN